MKRRYNIFAAPAVLLSCLLLTGTLLAEQGYPVDTGWVKQGTPNKINGNDGFAFLNPSYPCTLYTNPQSAIQNLSSTESVNPKLDSAAFVRKTKKLQIPFVANNGQVDEQVKFYAKTFGGTVFVTKGGEIVYALPNNRSKLGVQGLESSGKEQDRGRKGFRLPSLRTVQAGLPHTALQSVVTPSGLTD